MDRIHQPLVKEAPQRIPSYGSSIEDLYAPLYGLIQFGAAFNEIKWLRVSASDRDPTTWHFTA